MENINDRSPLLDIEENHDDIVADQSEEPHVEIITEPVREPNDDIVSERRAVSVNTESARETLAYKWKVLGACMNSVVHTLIGASVFVTLWFAFKSTSVSAFELHIGLNVIGYQLLMSHAILSLNSCNSWSSQLTLAHRRRVHWILQLAGSVAAITGSTIMMRHKSVNFNTIHGKLALAALIFTCTSLINGLTSLYAVELRRFIPMKVSKISHIALGTGAFALSTVCLAFGYIKSSFKEWASEEFAYVMIGMTCTYTIIILLTPCLSVWKRIYEFVKIKIY